MDRRTFCHIGRPVRRGRLSCDACLASPACPAIPLGPANQVGPAHRRAVGTHRAIPRRASRAPGPQCRTGTQVGLPARRIPPRPARRGPQLGTAKTASSLRSRPKECPPRKRARAERIRIDELLRTTDQELAAKNRELDELRQQLQEPGRGGPAAPADAAPTKSSIAMR